MSGKMKFYEFPNCEEKFVREDGSCDFLLSNHPLDLTLIECGLENPIELDDDLSMARLKGKLEMAMQCLLLKKDADTQIALKKIKDEFAPLIEELQYFIDKYSALIHLRKRYDVVVKEKS